MNNLEIELKKLKVELEILENEKIKMTDSLYEMVIKINRRKMSIIKIEKLLK